MFASQNELKEVAEDLVSVMEGKGLSIIALKGNINLYSAVFFIRARGPVPGNRGKISNPFLLFYLQSYITTTLELYYYGTRSLF
jgi:hypothetical protein